MMDALDHFELGLILGKAKSKNPYRRNKHLKGLENAYDSAIENVLVELQDKTQTRKEEKE